MSGFRNRGGRIGAASGLGHVAGKIAHTLERGSQTHGGNDHTQIGGHRILLGEQLDALVNHRGLQGIDFDVAVNHSLCGFNVLIQQGFPSSFDRLAYVLRHTVEVVSNLLQLLVENNAHFSSLSCLLIATCTSVLFQYLFPTST